MAAPTPFMAGLGPSFIPHAADSSFPSDHASIFSAVGSMLVLGTVRSLTGWERWLSLYRVAWHYDGVAFDRHACHAAGGAFLPGDFGPPYRAWADTTITGR